MCICRALACKGSHPAQSRRAFASLQSVRDSSGSAKGAATNSPTLRPLSRVSGGEQGHAIVTSYELRVTIMCLIINELCATLVTRNS